MRERAWRFCIWLVELFQPHRIDGGGAAAGVGGGVHLEPGGGVPRQTHEAPRQDRGRVMLDG